MAVTIKGKAPVSNGAKTAVDISAPYRVRFTIKGTADVLFHRWNCESVKEKEGKPKGSNAKKVDDVESYLYRDAKGEICVPSEWVRMAMVVAAKSTADPRSPRKSASDLFKATVVFDTMLATVGKKVPDYEHQCRAVVQRQGINRVRPALSAGWEATFDVTVLSGNYISPDLFHAVLGDAGRYQGVGDFRPTYGRYAVTNFKVV